MGKLSKKITKDLYTKTFIQTGGMPVYVGKPRMYGGSIAFFPRLLETVKGLARKGRKAAKQVLMSPEAMELMQTYGPGVFTPEGRRKMAEEAPKKALKMGAKRLLKHMTGGGGGDQTGGANIPAKSTQKLKTKKTKKITPGMVWKNLPPP